MWLLCKSSHNPPLLFTTAYRSSIRPLYYIPTTGSTTDGFITTPYIFQPCSNKLSTKKKKSSTYKLKGQKVVKTVQIQDIFYYHADIFFDLPLCPEIRPAHLHSLLSSHLYIDANLDSSKRSIFLFPTNFTRNYLSTFISTSNLAHFNISQEIRKQ